MSAMEAVLAARRNPVAEAKPEAARGPGADLRFQASKNPKPLNPRSINPDRPGSACWFRPCPLAGPPQCRRRRDACSAQGAFRQRIGSDLWELRRQWKSVLCCMV